MCEQMVHCDLMAVVGQLWKMLADVVGERKASVFDEEKDRCGDELLPHRSDIEDRVWAQWNVAFEVGRAVSAVHDHLSVLRDGDRAPGRGRRGPFEDLVGLT